MNEAQFSLLEKMFYETAPPDYILHFENVKRQVLRGFCDYSKKLCVLYKQDDIFDAMWTLLHELAHAVTGGGHTIAWETAFVRLLDKYAFPKEEKPPFSQTGPIIDKWLKEED